MPRFVIDGEIVALAEDGRPSFQRLQARMHLTRGEDIDAARAAVPVTGFFFDCLAAEGRDLRRVPLVDRKRCLELLVPPRGVVRYCEHVAAGGPSFFEAVGDLGLEGIVAKRAASRYAAGRSRDWLKVKAQRRGDFVVGGYTAPQGSRGHFGALHLGLYDDAGLVYVSKVGTGFDEKALAGIARAAGAAGPRHFAFRRRHAGGTRASLGGAAAGRPRALHGLDDGRWDPPSRLSRPPRGSAARGLPARAPTSRSPPRARRPPIRATARALRRPPRRRRRARW